VRTKLLLAMAARERGGRTTELHGHIEANISRFAARVHREHGRPNWQEAPRRSRQRGEVEDHKLYLLTDPRRYRDTSLPNAVESGWPHAIDEQHTLNTWLEDGEEQASETVPAAQVGHHPAAHLRAVALVPHMSEELEAARGGGGGWEGARMSEKEEKSDSESTQEAWGGAGGADARGGGRQRQRAAAAPRRSARAPLLARGANAPLKEFLQVEALALRQGARQFVLQLFAGKVKANGV
jgi:hypothetical protein